MHILCWVYFIFGELPFKTHTHTTQRLRITAIHSWITFRPMNQCLSFSSPLGSFSSSGYQQLSPTNRNPHLTWSSFLFAGWSYSPLSSHCFCEWENSLQLLFDLFWLWRNIYRVFIVIFGPAWLIFTHNQIPPPLLEQRLSLCHQYACHIYSSSLRAIERADAFTSFLQRDNFSVCDVKKQALAREILME